MKQIEIESISDFQAAGTNLQAKVIQNLDFSNLTVDWQSYQLEGTVFLGCCFHTDPRQHNKHKARLVEAGALLFPRFKELPYNPYRQGLYTWQELMTGCDFASGTDNSYDKSIYLHFERTGRETPHIMEAMARRIHDHAIDDALYELIENKKVVAVCGGHSTLRTDPYYKKVALLTRRLTQTGFLTAGGGGPGIMEACNLGAYFAAYKEQDLEEALQILAKAPHFRDKDHAPQAKKVIEKFPQGKESLAIPTWFYGHEPSNLFASHIAKYFSNSIREDGLLAIAKHGIIFAPGSAGTTQEIFMDAVQNHYGTFGCYSPMVFLGEDRYNRETLIFPLIEQLARDKTYRQMITLTDSPEAALEFITSHPPLPVEK